MTRSAVVTSVLILWLCRSAQATPITGSLWGVADAVAQSAIPANIPLTAPDVIFNVNAPLNFNPLHIGPQIVLEWLLSGGAFNINGRASALIKPMAVPGSTGTIVQFLGSVDLTTGQTITATHDDGLTLILGGTNLGFDAGPSGLTTSTTIYTGASGTFPFQLIYGECCGSPAVLHLNLSLQPSQPQPVPEPMTLTLLGSGLVLVALRRRFQSIR